jgi:hypothetical protein
MSYVIEQTKLKIKELEELLENPETGDYQKECLPKTIQSYKNRLEVLEGHEEDLAKVSNDMKAILSHTHAIEDKYNCRTVKFMFKLADFVENHISLALGKWIADYTVHNIHAPVCSIVAGSKPELPPMPQYYDLLSGNREAWRKAQQAEMKRLREISINFLEKPPTFREQMAINYTKFVKRLLPRGKNESNSME